MQMHRTTFLIGLTLVLVVTAGLGALDAQPAQKVVFALNWFAVGDHAAYWSRSTAATTGPRGSTSSCRTRRARATRSPRSTRTAPISVWPTRSS